MREKTKVYIFLVLIGIIVFYQIAFLDWIFLVVNLLFYSKKNVCFFFLFEGIFVGMQLFFSYVLKGMLGRYFPLIFGVVSFLGVFYILMPYLLSRDPYRELWEVYFLLIFIGISVILSQIIIFFKRLRHE